MGTASERGRRILARRCAGECAAVRPADQRVGASRGEGQREGKRAAAADETDETRAWAHGVTVQKTRTTAESPRAGLYIFTSPLRFKQCEK